jgi:exosortase A-associated hydrolase 2
VTAAALSGHFVAGARGRLFVVQRGPAGGPAGGIPCVLVVPPFAEEMNKARRMVTLVAERLGRAGVTTVLPDLYGTGDSEGDFVDADWTTWQDDLRRVAAWCAGSVGPVRGLLAIRLGCALACSEPVLDALPQLTRTAFWQPVLDGERSVTQFLRLRVAASLANDLRESVASLREQLATAGEVEVAGYRLSRRLVEELDRVRVPTSLDHRLGAVDWCEIVRTAGLDPPPATSALLRASEAAGVEVRAHAIAGEPFWATTEIVTNDELLSRTVAVFATPGTARNSRDGGAG